MKKIFYSILTAAALLSAASCEKFLTVTPQDTIMSETFYVSKEAIRSNTAILYTQQPWFDFTGPFMFYSGDMMAGDLYYTYSDEGQFYYNTVTSTNSYLYNGWKGLYRIVSLANSVIVDMPDAARSNNVAESDIAAAVAEAQTMRAVAYYFLTELWGEVPIIENATEIITSDDPSAIFVNKHTQESLYKFMVRDLEAAIPALPSVDLGRATKTTAMGMLAKVYLTYAAYKQSDDLYALAKDWAKKAVDEGLSSGYGLYGDFAKMFGIEGNNCMESVLAVQCQSAGYACGNARNVNLTRSKRIADDTWGAGKGPTISLQSLFLKENPDSLKDFVVEDKRRAATFMTAGDFYAELASAEGGYLYQYTYRDPENLATQVEANNEMLSHVRKYIVGKNSDCGGNAGTNQDAGNNVYLLRFADIMMVYIEACIGTGNSTSDPTALDYMSQILSRAGLVSTYSSITFEDIIRERRKEFALEGINWYDVKRLWYRDHAAGIAYLDNMERDKKYVLNWSAMPYEGNALVVEDAYVLEQKLENYCTIYEFMNISATMTDPVTGAEVTDERYYMGAEYLKENGHRINNFNFADSKMNLPIPEAEATLAPILKEPAVEYVFAE